MTKQELLKAFAGIQKALADGDFYDAENAHEQADELLLKYIHDEEITTAYDAIKWWNA